MANIDQTPRRVSQGSRLGDSDCQTPRPHYRNIKIFEDGTHCHVLKARNSGHPSNWLCNTFARLMQRYGPKGPPASEATNEPSTIESFSKKYGKCDKILHYGSSTSVKLYSKKASIFSSDKKLYAVKAYHRLPRERMDHYRHSVRSISSYVDHPNIVRTIEVCYNERGDLYAAMEYYDGSSLHALIAASGKLATVEADCFFKQLMRAVSYLHDNGIAHRYLKTENILLTIHGAVRVAHFDGAEWLQTGLQPISHAWRWSGKIPYIAPEELKEANSDYYDPRAGDIWAAGLIYMAMRCGRLPWSIAREEEDRNFEEYLRARQQEDGYFPIEALCKEHRCNVIYAMLDPKPHRRLTASDALQSKWIHEVVVCSAGETGQ
ncbi:hypothetical protein AWENTII_000682 [Aspergillus wentii]